MLILQLLKNGNAAAGAAVAAAWCASRMIHRSEHGLTLSPADPKILPQHVLHTDCHGESRLSPRAALRQQNFTY